MTLAYNLVSTVVPNRYPPKDTNYRCIFPVLYRPGLATVYRGGFVLERYVEGNSETDFVWLVEELPTNFAVDGTADDTIEATWILHSGSLETGVQLEIDTVNTFNSGDYQVFDLALNAESYEITGLVAATTYYLRIRLVHNGVYSDWSDIETTATLP